MDSSDRHSRILTELSLTGRLSVSEFAAREGITPMTVRRDLAILADRGLLRRTHGGALPLPGMRAPLVSASVPIPRRPNGKEQFVFGLVVPDRSYYFPPVIAGAVSQIEALGGRVVLGIAERDAKRELDQISRLIESGVGGLLITPTAPEANGSLDVLAAAPMPVVIIERAVETLPGWEGFEIVRSDHAAGGEMAIEHLFSLGHRRIGTAAFNTGTNRLTTIGLDRALQRRGTERGPSLTLSYDVGDDRDKTVEWLRRCVAEGVTAIIVHPDNYAIEVVAAARSMGLDIPGDLSVVAYDDEVASLADVPLTAIAPPKLELGRIGAMMCFERLSVRERETEVPVRHLTLRPSLVERASTARLIE